MRLSQELGGIVATGEKSKICRNIRELKEFIKDIPDKMPVRGTFSEDRVEFTIYKADKCESGPRKYVGVDSIMF